MGLPASIAKCCFWSPTKTTRSTPRCLASLSSSLAGTVASSELSSTIHNSRPVLACKGAARSLAMVRASMPTCSSASTLVVVVPKP